MEILIYLSIFVFVVCKTNSSENTGCGCSLNRQHSNSNNRYRDIRSFYDTVTNTRRCDSKKNTNTVMKDANIEFKDMALVEGGEYRIGTDNPVIKVDKESPARLVTLPPFYIDLHEVSNKKFREFVSKSGYVTEAENFGNSFVFQLFLNESFKESLKDYRVANALWWYRVDGANWQHPEGPGSHIEDRLKHPVVHVSWNDARAYCKWARKRLPTENEWEAACRAQHPYRIYPWGNKLNLNDKHWANIWQGKFPNKNTALDGFVGTNPVDEFVQNDLGLCNMAGNVWEWTEDYWNPNTIEMVKKGGSYLCHKSYCFRYRCSARSQNTQDSSAHNLGFRCVKGAS